MLNPLKINERGIVDLEVVDKFEKERFVCTKLEDYINGNKKLISRYHLKHENTDKKILLDVNPDKTIHYYELLESKDFDIPFLSIVGTNPFGYHNPKHPNVNYVIYDKSPQLGEEFENIKILVTQDQLPSDPQKHGYYKDGNNNWYFLTKRSKGAVHQYSKDDIKITWTYKQEEYNSLPGELMIEVDAYYTMKEFYTNQPNILIYEGNTLPGDKVKVRVL